MIIHQSNYGVESINSVVHPILTEQLDQNKTLVKLDLSKIDKSKVGGADFEI